MKLNNKSFKILKIYFFIIIFSTFYIAKTQAQSATLTPEAKQIFEKHHTSVVQIRVISRDSGEKAALGSGFFFNDNGIVATNFHVVSNAVNYPSLYFVEYIMFDGTRGNLEILNVDPIHDLSILRADTLSANFLELGDSHLNQGEKIFSFGNPYDLGMIIIEGLYNGLLEHSKYKKILFSGALNSGMSGGPAVSDDGKILGVNVSTAGNDISFFVPVEYLKDLYQEVIDNNGKALGTSWGEVIREHLLNDQEAYLKKLVEDKKWNKRFVGIAKVPGDISNEFKCWGRPGDNKRQWIKDTYLSCSTDDHIFISDSLYTGTIYFQYEWYESRTYDPIRFYNLYEKYAANREYYFNNAAQRDVGNFECEQEIVDINGHACKVEVCARSYKTYLGLFDTNVQISLADLWSQGLVINLTMLGVTELQSKKFLNKFLNEIEWQK